ncbi:Agglutinin-2 protein [Spatholobus suberectus]|nr:Agglutinin-2 protein [Spatholobus suberectus]
MTIFNTNLQTNKPLSLALLALITMLLMLLSRVNSTDYSISFTINNFDVDHDGLVLEGDATTNTSDKVLQLTEASNLFNVSRARALYYAPVRLWKSSEEVASFETNLTFLISSLPYDPRSPPADGFTFTFFIASPTIPSGDFGKLLGLFPNGNALTNSSKEIIDFEEAESNKSTVKAT